MSVQEPIQGLNSGYRELGRTKLTAVADVITINIPSGFRYLLIEGDIIGSGVAECLLRFNGDSGNNYSWRESANGAADTTLASTSSIVIRPSITNGDISFSARVMNLATRVKKLLGVTNGIIPGAANIPAKKEVTGQWANTTDLITSIASVNTQSGDYAADSELVVLGMN